MISIVIPVYNQADKISRTLDSILNQSYQNFEVLIVNDGSTDDVAAVVAAQKKKFDQRGIRYEFINQANQGAPAARNAGWRLAKGEYLFFCDADAQLRSNCLELLLKGLSDNPRASYAYPSFFWGRKLFKLESFSAERLRQAPFIHTMALIRAQDFPAAGWDESIKKLQDWDLWLTMLAQNKTGVYVDEILFEISPGGHISNWLPSIAYKILPFLPQVKKYKQAVVRVKSKHGIKD